MPLKRGSTREVIASTDRAYAAGLFDGEGSISASPSHHCSINFRVTVAITMCDYEPLEWFATRFGGHVRTEKRSTNSGKQVFAWERYCGNAAKFLTAVLPYLKVKRTRAINAIALARLSKPRGKATTHVFTVDEIAQRRLLVAKIREANAASNGRLIRHAPPQGK